MDDSYVSSLASRALPTSQMVLLAKRCCTNRDSAVSSSRRLPTSFGGLLGLLGESFGNLKYFSDAPKRAPRAVWGLFFRLPTSWAVL